MTMLQDIIGNTDIYLLDQILKGRYISGQKILEVGCGSGRNLKWFAQNDFELYGMDRSEEALQKVKENYPKYASNFQCGVIENLPYEKDSFHHVICSAVLHFAEDEKHFKKMFKEMVRVLQTQGSIFIRMTTDHGIKNTIQAIKGGVYYLKDDTYRFLITSKMLDELIVEHSLELLEPFKTTLVEDVRSMGTIVLQKK